MAWWEQNDSQDSESPGNSFGSQPTSTNAYQPPVGSNGYHPPTDPNGYPGGAGYQGGTGFPGQQGYLGGQGYGYGYPGPEPPGDPMGLGRPSYLPTFLVTFFFGAFGLIPAFRHSKMARLRGYPEQGYWWTFGLTMVIPIVFWIVFYVTILAVANHEINNLNNGISSLPTYSSGINEGAGSDADSGLGSSPVAGPAPSDTDPAASTPADEPTAAQGTGTIMRVSCATMQSEPTTDSANVGCVPEDADITIDCTAYGEAVANSYDGETSLWDHTTYNGVSGYINDYQVNTGTSAPVAPTCQS
jgi:hypothetical protein